MTDNTENTQVEPEVLAEETPTTEQVADQTEEISNEEKLQIEVAEMKDKYIRMYSEFENFRRRTAKEKTELILNASEGVIKDLLPVLDDFERALQSLETTEDITAIKEGISLIYNKFNKTLTQKGLKPMESKDTDFDPEIHESITQFPAGDDKKGKVIDEVEKGYFLNEKVIRYAKVVVGS
ncbi:MAG: nucleotide exchange factor GrpE [Arcicella sp.]|jgi:molecular chaperone GrpE|nr:nucleotide exchange factor GrpE [Arcicella sp.]